MRAAATLFTLLAVAASLSPDSGTAQTIAVQPLPELGPDTEDAARRDQLLGNQSAAGFLARSTSSLFTRTFEGDEVFRLTAFLPTARFVWNSGLPFSMNDGGLWSGRGLNMVASAGIHLRFHRIRLMLAPQAWYSENKDFPWFPYQTAKYGNRSPFAHLFHPMPESLDQPLRFGADPLGRVAPGQSSVHLDVGAWSVGIGTENWWWGPGIRNALLLSNQAEGFPHITIGTSRPVDTGWGDVEARWILGRLAESDFFDFDPDNDHRSLSALTLSLTPRFDPGLTLGLARMVVAPMNPDDHLLRSAFNVLQSVGRPNAVVADPDDWIPGPDQITAIFGRWIVPRAGFEVFGEWARFEEPRSIRDFLEFPQHSQGYTYGAQWVTPGQLIARTRVQVEVTNLEPSSTWRHRRIFGSYTSSAVPQGFTHKGQLLGAAIGPAASSQWFALDRLWDSGSRIGVFGGRVRPEAAAWATDVVPGPKRQDLFLFWGVRGALRHAEWVISGELSPGVRLNYLFQTYVPDPVTGRAEGVDVSSTSLSVTISRFSRR